MTDDVIILSDVSFEQVDPDTFSLKRIDLDIDKFKSSLRELLPVFLNPKDWYGILAALAPLILGVLPAFSVPDCVSYILSFIFIITFLFLFFKKSPIRNEERIEAIIHTLSFDFYCRQTLDKSAKEVLASKEKKHKNLRDKANTNYIKARRDRKRYSTGKFKPC